MTRNLSASANNPYTTSDSVNRTLIANTSMTHITSANSTARSKDVLQVLYIVPVRSTEPVLVQSKEALQVMSIVLVRSTEPVLVRLTIPVQATL